MKNFAIALLAAGADAANYLTTSQGWLPDPVEHSHFNKVWQKEKIPAGSIAGYKFEREDVDEVHMVEICELVPATIDFIVNGIIAHEEVEVIKEPKNMQYHGCKDIEVCEEHFECEK